MIFSVSGTSLSWVIRKNGGTIFSGPRVMKKIVNAAARSFIFGFFDAANQSQCRAGFGRDPS
jgi:hypothetical protein